MDGNLCGLEFGSTENSQALNLTMAKSSDIYQIKVKLSPINPPIWRRILVQGDTRLDQLHLILQTVMGWQNIQRHQFMVDRNCYGQPDPSYGGWGLDLNDEKQAKLHQIIFRPQSRFSYNYGLGEGWEHVLLVEKILPSQQDIHYPCCIKGKRACPPEDVGSITSYKYLLEIFADPTHPDYKEVLTELGRGFDPEVFDLHRVSKALTREFVVH